MLNLTIMTGRLTHDPDLRDTKSGIPVTSFRIAVRRDFAKKEESDTTDFFDVIAWRAMAEFVCKYFVKGSMITIVGHLENRNWTDKHDQNRVTAELVTDKAYFGESKGKNDDSGGTYQFGDDDINIASSAPPLEFDPFAKR
jgi:single-strand DNA-binding protein